MAAGSAAPVASAAAPPKPSTSQSSHDKRDAADKEVREILETPSRVSDQEKKPLMYAAASSTPILRDCNFGGVICELLVVEAVREYLQFHGLQETLDAMDRALGKTRLPALFQVAEAAGAGVDDTSERLVDGHTELAVIKALCEFDDGKKDAFFDLWKHLVPSPSASPLGCSLELRLHVYFGTYLTRKALEDASGNESGAGGVPVSDPDFTDLKAFLATRPSAGADATQQSLSPLYALPFVPRPQQNAALRFIFEEPWSQKLRTDLQAFLMAHASTRHAPFLRHLAGALIMSSCPAASPPHASWHEMLRIADLGLSAASQAMARNQMFGKPQSQSGQQPASLQSAGGSQPQDPQQMVALLSVAGKVQPELLKQALEARRRLGKVVCRPEDAPAPAPQEIPGSMRPSIQSLIRAQSCDLDVPQGVSSPSQGVPVYQDHLWPMSREALRGSSASSLNASHSNPNARRLHSARSIESRARTATALLPVPPALDFGRISALINREVSEEQVETPPLLAVLRAVLRRLALADEPIRPRRAFLAAFACFGALRALALRLREMVHGGDAPLLEMSLAVMGVCACEVVGRREIEAAEAQGSGCLSTLISVVSLPDRTLAHMHCLAVLQRLSLRGHLQSKMIQLGALDVVLKLLESVRRVEGDADSNSSGQGWCRLGPGEGPETPDFSIEFTSALLMNLTLRSAGRRRCADLGAYGILVGLIEHPNPQVRTHINGTLYTLLGVSAIRAEAQQKGAEAVFRSALKRVGPDNDLLQRQLEFLLHQLSRAASENESDGEDSEEDTADPKLEGDADDGDNFLDEEELAAHFHLTSTALVQGDGIPQAEVDAIAEMASTEAAAAEEALRCFRASAAVADAQHQKFHAYIARSYRMMSPKRRGHSSDRLMSPLSPPMLSPTPSPEPGALSANESPVKMPMRTPAEEANALLEASTSEKSPDALGSLSPSTGDEKPQSASPAPTTEGQAPRSGPTKPAKNTEGALMKAAEQAQGPRRKPREQAVSQERPTSRSENSEAGPGGRGARSGPAQGRGRGRGSQGAPGSVTKSASLPPVPESKATPGGRVAPSANRPSPIRSRSEAPRRSQQAQAAAAIEAAAAIGEERGFRRPKNGTSLERQSNNARPRESASPQLPRLPTKRR
ncbi:armc9 [Symbiodinium natans]|uniref:Armc9 protein n=1 Tax=Symbiodinium natans TaxID=878477 RepID=A0A812J7B4_9DINO|nr:armc9 [Symbiodinium natans]